MSNPSDDNTSDGNTSDGPGVGAAVRLVVELQLGRDQVALDQHLVSQLNADSFDVMNIVAVLEEQHEIVITEQAAAGVMTVRDLVDLVASLIQA